MTIYLTKLGELALYPPVLSLIRILRDLGYSVVYIGSYYDTFQKESLINKGVKFIETVNYLPEYNPLLKLYCLIKYRRQVKRALVSNKASSNDVLWLFNSESICLLSKFVKDYKTVLHFFEFCESKINPKYFVINFGRGFKGILNKSKAIVQCEYNRAQIFKGLYNIDVLPFVLPNKPYLEEQSERIPEDLSPIIDEITRKSSGKKVILYQGYFNSEQRKLEEFCMAIPQLPHDYILIIMGRGNAHFESLKQKFSSPRILFVPFIRPPYHLNITRLARIGILSYFPTGRSLSEIINPLYCAPNKVFEYGKYSIPMISNDIPGLKCIFNSYKCGLCIDYPMTSNKIAATIVYLDNNYESFSQGSGEYYNSVNIKSIVQKILNSI